MQEKESSSSRNEHNLKVIEWKPKRTVQQSQNQELMLEAREDESQAPCEGGSWINLLKPRKDFSDVRFKKTKATEK